MSTANLDAYNLKVKNLDGLIHEDVMDQLFDVSRIPLPLTDRIGTSEHDNQYFSWTMDKLQAPTTDDQQIDGSDQTGDDTKTGRRVGNHSEIRTRRVPVSSRAQAVNTIGYANALAENLTRRQQELRRSVEATALSNNGSVEGTDTVAGVTAGLNAWICNVDVDGNALTGTDIHVTRGATGADGGWDAAPGGSADGLVKAADAGTPEAITEKKIRDVVQGIHQSGAEPSILMTTPAVKRLISEYMFTSSARIATMVNDSPGGAAEERKAQGSIDLFITDFGSLEIVSNRLQPEVAAGNVTAFIMDPAYVSMSYLHGYRTEPLAKTGLADNRQISVDWGLRVTNWEALGGVCDIDPAAAMTA